MDYGHMMVIFVMHGKIRSHIDVMKVHKNCGIIYQDMPNYQCGSSIYLPKAYCFIIIVLINQITSLIKVCYNMNFT